RRAGVLTGDPAAAGGEDVPLGAELVQPLTCGVPRLAVAGVVVERMPVVGHLGAAVVAPGAGAEQGTGHAGAGAWGGVAEVRRPRAGAGAVAAGHARLVRLEQVEGPALSVDQELPQPGAVGLDDCGRRGAARRGRTAALGR